MKRHQQGVALITAVLMVAVIAAIATSLAFAQQIWLRQTQNLVDLARAERLRQSAQEAAAAIVALDAKNPQTNTNDNLTEQWAQPIALPPIDGAAAQIKITDAQARFNLNNLIPPAPVPGPSGTPGSPSPDVSVYRTLLETLRQDPDLDAPSLKSDPAKVDRLINALLDWLDADGNLLPGGAEDLDYLNKNPPYRAANAPLASVDELRLVEGYDEDIVRALRPHVVALPASNAAINVNTAHPHVIAALTGLNLQAAAELARISPTQTPYQDKGAFNTAVGRNLTGTYDVATKYFIVQVTIRVGRIHRTTEALIDRSQGARNVKVLWHQQPPLEIKPDEDKDKT